MLDFSEIRKIDGAVADAIVAELERQQHNIELIASENIVSKAVMYTMGTPLTNKYAEGYPAKRYYGGCEKVDIVEGDIKETAAIFGGAVFDVVTSNPPYMNEGGGLQNPSGPKAIARHEVLCTLEDVVKGAAKVLRPGGRFYMVHRPHRLTDIICTLRQYGLEPKRLRFVHSFVEKAPSMVLVEAGRGGKPMVKVEPPLVIYKAPGEYTDEIYDIYYGEGQA